MDFYESIPWYSVVMWLGILAGLLIFNEITRFNKQAGIFFFIILPIILTVFVWPETSGETSGAQTANWFAWIKVYSALIGCWIGLFLRFVYQKTWSKYFLILAPGILVINILEAVIREVEVVGMQGIGNCQRSCRVYSSCCFDFFSLASLILVRWIQPYFSHRIPVSGLA